MNREWVTATSALADADPHGRERSEMNDCKTHDLVIHELAPKLLHIKPASPLFSRSRSRQTIVSDMLITNAADVLPASPDG